MRQSQAQPKATGFDLIASVSHHLMAWKWSRGAAEQPSSAMRLGEVSKRDLENDHAN